MLLALFKANLSKAIIITLAMPKAFKFNNNSYNNAFKSLVISLNTIVVILALLAIPKAIIILLAVVEAFNFNNNNT